MEAHSTESISMIPLFRDCADAVKYAQRCFDQAKTEPWRVNAISRVVSNLFLHEHEQIQSGREGELVPLEHDQLMKLAYTCMFSLGCIGHAILDRMETTAAAPRVKCWRDVFQSHLDRSLFANLQARVVTRTPEDIRAAINAEDRKAFEAALAKNYSGNQRKQEVSNTQACGLIAKRIKLEHAAAIVRRKDGSQMVEDNHHSRCLKMTGPQECQLGDYNVSSKRRKVIGTGTTEESEESHTKVAKLIEVPKEFRHRTPCASHILSRPNNSGTLSKVTTKAKERSVSSKRSRRLEHGHASCERESEPLQKGICRIVKREILDEDKDSDSGYDSMDDWLVDDCKQLTRRKKTSTARRELNKWFMSR